MGKTSAGPSSHPEEFPTFEEQSKERERLFSILRELVIWENSNNKEVLDKAKAEILKSTDNTPPSSLTHSLAEVPFLLKLHA